MTSAVAEGIRINECVLRLMKDDIKTGSGDRLFEFFRHSKESRDEIL